MLAGRMQKQTQNYCARHGLEIDTHEVFSQMPQRPETLGAGFDPADPSP
jgi:hypothetical protein